jgi:membrane protein DedA with SNARE-associated domain
LSFQALLDSYGYLAIIVGTFLEGETALILGSIAAQLGYLELPWVIASALSGTLIGDQFYFFLGRFKGKAVLRNRPHWQARTSKVFNLLQRHEALVILGFRFMYGIRTVASFVIGMSHVATAKFIILNVLGALFWAVIVGGFGYAFGKAFEVLIVDIKHYQVQVISVIAVMGVLFWLFYNYNRRKRSAVIITPEESNK